LKKRRAWFLLSGELRVVTLLSIPKPLHSSGESEIRAALSSPDFARTACRHPGGDQKQSANWLENRHCFGRNPSHAKRTVHNFSEGRAFKDGNWIVVDKDKKVTALDGYKKKSRHNYLPATAVDIVLFRPNGEELESGPQEQKIGKGAAKYDLEWGGNWQGWQDLPHIQIPLNRLFKNSLDRDEGLQWQKYLFQAGALTEPEDLGGIFGEQSKKALQALIGTTKRTPDAWEKTLH